MIRWVHYHFMSLVQNPAHFHGQQKIFAILTSKKKRASEKPLSYPLSQFFNSSYSSSSNSYGKPKQRVGVESNSLGEGRRSRRKRSYRERRKLRLLEPTLEIFCWPDVLVYSRLRLPFATSLPCSSQIDFTSPISPTFTHLCTSPPHHSSASPPCCVKSAPLTTNPQLKENMANTHTHTFTHRQGYMIYTEFALRFAEREREREK